MSSIAELIADIDAVEQRRAEQRAAKAEQADRYSRFYKSRAYRAARYQFWCRQEERPVRCRACGVTAAQARLVCDHIVPIKKDWSRRLDQSNFQILCNDCNLAKASSDQTDWRTDSESAVQTGANK
jgi:5-methylcytosine-specific restriction endonuclease McrA